MDNPPTANLEDYVLPGQPLTPSQVERGYVHDARDIRYAQQERLTERFGTAWFTECQCAFCAGRRNSN